MFFYLVIIQELEFTKGIITSKSPSILQQFSLWSFDNI